MMEKCAECNGTGLACDYVGLEMRPVGVPCPSCTPSPAPAVGELVEELRWLKNNLNHVIMSGEKERLRLAIEEAAARIMAPPVGELTDADFEKIMERAESAYRRFSLVGLRNQTVTMQDDLAWWVAKETMVFFTARIEQLEANAKHHGNYILKLEDEAIADESRIKQLEAGLEAALPYVEATNRADHLMDGFGPRSRQSSDEHVAAIRALLKGQS